MTIENGTAEVSLGHVVAQHGWHESSGWYSGSFSLFPHLFWVSWS